MIQPNYDQTHERHGILREEISTFKFPWCDTRSPEATIRNQQNMSTSGTFAPLYSFAVSGSRHGSSLLCSCLRCYRRAKGSLHLEYPLCELPMLSLEAFIELQPGKRQRVGGLGLKKSRRTNNLLERRHSQNTMGRSWHCCRRAGDDVPVTTPFLCRSRASSCDSSGFKQPQTLKNPKSLPPNCVTPRLLIPSGTRKSAAGSPAAGAVVWSAARKISPGKSKNFRRRFRAV